MASPPVLPQTYMHFILIALYAPAILMTASTYSTRSSHRDSKRRDFSGPATTMLLLRPMLSAEAVTKSFLIHFTKIFFHETLSIYMLCSCGVDFVSLRKG